MWNLYKHEGDKSHISIYTTPREAVRAYRTAGVSHQKPCMKINWSKATGGRRSQFEEMRFALEKRSGSTRTRVFGRTEERRHERRESCGLALLQTSPSPRPFLFLLPPTACANARAGVSRLSLSPAHSPRALCIVRVLRLAGGGGGGKGTSRCN
jgi:hypothetical protein